MSRPSASMSIVKGFSLTFDDIAAFTTHMLYSPTSPSTPVRDVPKISEGRSPDYDRVTAAFQLDRRPRHRHSASSSSAGSWRSSSSYAPRSSASSRARTGSRAPPSPRFVDHPPRRLTERERATLGDHAEPEMDITDMVGMCRDQGMGFEPIR